jgi:hypothetical protein
MNEVQQDDLVRLREIYVQKLGVGPFPVEECSIARIRGRLHGELVIYLADIAGIASHGVKLANLGELRRLEFQELVARSFWELNPTARQKITMKKTPVLFQLLADTEEARLLIKKYFGI